MKRRVLSVLLSLCLVLSLLPTAAFAQGESYVALGDSITTGYGLTDAENDGFAALVAQEQGYVLDNLAKVGATSEIWTMPVLPSPRSTNAPNLVMLVTLPSKMLPT